MASREIHEQDCFEELGDGFTQVHQWLDEFFMRGPWGTRHRCFRHHRRGIEEVRKLWGDKAARAAEIHIRRDLKDEGYNKEYLPRDSEEYSKLGLW